MQQCHIINGLVVHESTLPEKVIFLILWIVDTIYIIEHLLSVMQIWIFLM